MDTTTTSTSGPRSHRMLSLVMAAGIGVWLAAIGTETASAEAIQKRSIEIAFNDLNVSTEPGARLLLKRIDRAARKVCDQRSHSQLLPRSDANYRRCVAGAVDAAVNQVGSPLLASLRRSQPGVRLASR